MSSVHGFPSSTGTQAAPPVQLLLVALPPPVPLPPVPLPPVPLLLVTLPPPVPLPPVPLLLVTLPPPVPLLLVVVVELLPPLLLVGELGSLLQPPTIKAISAVTHNPHALPRGFPMIHNRLTRHPRQ